MDKIIHRDKKGRIIIDISPAQKGAMDLQKRIDDISACFLLYCHYFFMFFFLLSYFRCGSS
jgi:hypothetical protein